MTPVVEMVRRFVINEMERPIFELKFDEEVQGLTAVALVDEPAIGLKGYAFNKDENPYKFEVINEEKRLIMGPAMIPDLPIYRYDADRGEYSALFSADTIAQLVEAFRKQPQTDQFNLMHDGNQVPGIFLRDSFIVSDEMGIQAPKQFENIGDGAWFITAKVEDDDTWERVKADGLVGFSVEGRFKEVPFNFAKTETGYTILKDEPTQDPEPETFEAKVVGMFNDLKTKLSKLIKGDTPEGNTATLAKFNGTEIAEGVEVFMGEAQLENGTVVKWDGELVEGVAFMVVTGSTELKAEDGSYELEDGRIVQTAGGLVTEIMPAPHAAGEEMAEVVKMMEDMMDKKVADLVAEIKAQLGPDSYVDIYAYFNKQKEEAEQSAKDMTEQLDAFKAEVAKSLEQFETVGKQITDALRATDQPTHQPGVTAPKSEEGLKFLANAEKYKAQLAAAMPKNTLHKLSKNTKIEK